MTQFDRNKLLKIHRPLAQAYAAATGEATDLVVTQEGRTHLVLHGWPLRGSERLGTYYPKEEVSNG